MRLALLSDQTLAQSDNTLTPPTPSLRTRLSDTQACLKMLPGTSARVRQRCVDRVAHTRGASPLSPSTGTVYDKLLEGRQAWTPTNGSLPEQYLSVNITGATR